jgi:Rad3-related DNA helicase
MEAPIRKVHLEVWGKSSDPLFVLFPNKMFMELLYGKYPDMLRENFMPVLEDEVPIIELL